METAKLVYRWKWHTDVEALGFAHFLFVLVPPSTYKQDIIGIGIAKASTQVYQ